jgi:hypothetical protein
MNARKEIAVGNPEKCIQTLLAQLTALRRQLTAHENIYAEAKLEAIPPDVQARRQAIDEACLPQIRELTEAAGQLEEQVKAAVLAYGSSIKGEQYHVIVSKGRVSWDDAFLQGYAATHPEILQGRIEREATVSLSKLR